jgi:hypothetical protein
LVAGKATFTKPLTIKCNLSYNPHLKKYQEKKVTYKLIQSTLAVYIISTTGRNIAGVCSFDAATLANIPNG